MKAKRTTGLMLALGAVFLCTPFYLDASAPRNGLSIAVKPRAARGTVGKVRIAARLDTSAEAGLQVQLTAVNPADKPAVARVRVDVFERAKMSRFARMAPMPMMRGSATLEIRLEPRQRLVKTVAVTHLGKPARIAAASLSRAYLAVRPAPAKRAAHAKVSASALAALVRTAR